MTGWGNLEAELALWASHGTPARLWLRDDDAVQPTEALNKLALLTGQFDVPITIAVIPFFVREELMTFVRQHLNFSVALHGHAHTNHAPRSEKKCELGLHRARQIVLDELTGDRAKLAGMFDDRFFNMLVPPWNRISPALVAELGSCGLQHLSTFGWENFPGRGSICQLNTHVDIIDWKGNRGGRDAGELAADLANALARARQKGGLPVGILTHHLVHDEAAWDFLQALLEFIACNPNAKWCHAASLSGETAG